MHRKPCLSISSFTKPCSLSFSLRNFIIKKTFSSYGLLVNFRSILGRKPTSELGNGNSVLPLTWSRLGSIVVCLLNRFAIRLHNLLCTTWVCRRVRFRYKKHERYRSKEHLGTCIPALALQLNSHLGVPGISGEFFYSNKGVMSDFRAGHP